MNDVYKDDAYKERKEKEEAHNFLAIHHFCSIFAEQFNKVFAQCSQNGGEELKFMDIISVKLPPMQDVQGFGPGNQYVTMEPYINKQKYKKW